MVQHVIQTKNGIMKYVNMSVKSIVRVQKIIVGILAHVFVTLVCILKNDDSVIVCDKIVNATDNVSTIGTNTIPTKMINTISAKVTSTMSTNSDDEKVKYKMNCCIVHTVLLVIILLFIIVIICYHYTKSKSKQKRIGAMTK